MSKHNRIIPAAHLDQPGAEGLSAFEYGLIVASGAFQRWDRAPSYTEVHEARLLQAFDALGLDSSAIEEAAGRLRALSEFYDQAARAAASL